MEVIRPGRFQNQLHVFVDDLGLREFVVMVQGQGTGIGGRWNTDGQGGDLW